MKEGVFCANSFCKQSGQPLSGKDVRCEFCKERHYCSTTCRLEDWNVGHSRVCEPALRRNLSRIEQTCPFLNGGVILSPAETKGMAMNVDAVLSEYEKANVEGKASCVLGKGSYGQVFLMRHRGTKKLIAMKTIEKKYVGNSSMLKSLTREIEIHKSLLHENIIRLYEHTEDSKNIYLLMEYAAKGSLFHFIRSKGKLTEKEAFYFFAQACNAVNFLHKNNLIHRDIKPENMLITQNGILKLCDFGCCTPCGNGERKTFCGTVEYMAPEIVKREGYREKADVWSLGVLLYEMLHGYSPFHGRRDQDTINQILENKLTFGTQVKEDARELVTDMLVEDPKARPCIAELFVYRWARRLQEEFKIKDRIVPSEDSKQSEAKPPEVAPAVLVPILKKEEETKVLVAAVEPPAAAAVTKPKEEMLIKHPPCTELKKDEAPKREQKTEVDTHPARKGPAPTVCLGPGLSTINTEPAEEELSRERATTPLNAQPDGSKAANMARIKTELNSRLLANATPKDDCKADEDAANDSFTSDEYAFQRSESLLKAVYYLDDLDCGARPEELERRIKELEAENAKLQAVCSGPAPVPEEHSGKVPPPSCPKDDPDVECDAEAEDEDEPEEQEAEQKKTVLEEVPRDMVYDFPEFGQSINCIMKSLAGMGPGSGSGKTLLQVKRESKRPVAIVENRSRDSGKGSEKAREKESGSAKIVEELKKPKPKEEKRGSSQGEGKKSIWSRLFSFDDEL